MYQNFISHHLSNQSGIIVLVNWPRAYCRVLQLTEASSLGPDSPWTSPRNETVKQCRRQMTVANSPVQWPSWTWCWTWWNHSWHSSRVTLNQRCFAYIRPRTPLAYRYHVISRTQSHIDCFTLLLAWHLADVSCYIGPSMPSGICMEIHTEIVQKRKKKPSRDKGIPRQPHVYL